MKFDYKDKSDPPDLASFKSKLVVHLFKTAFWQNEPKLPINMLKLPSIISPDLIAKQVNNDVKKDSLMDKSIQHSAETFREFVKMVDNKEINVTRLGTLKLQDLKVIGKSLKFKNVSDKSGEMLRQELQHLAKVFIAGQVRFHQKSITSDKLQFCKYNQPQAFIFLKHVLNFSGSISRHS
jgi:hypothetical protein